MKWLWRWLRKNMRSTPTSVEKMEKTEELFLHEGWLENFQADLNHWARRR